MKKVEKGGETSEIETPPPKVNLLIRPWIFLIAWFIRGNTIHGLCGFGEHFDKLPFPVLFLKIVSLN